MEPIHEEDVVRRLRSLGEQPVEPGVAERHVSSFAAAAPIVTHSRRRPAITAALVAGALLGGTGLAAALPGPLPTQASSVAKSALEVVNLAEEEEKDPAKEAAKVERAKARAAAKAARAANGQGVTRFLAGCTAGTPPTAFVGNHGQYVKAHPDDPATADVNEREVAAESNCGKPAKAVANKAAGGAEDDESGKPEDAGKPEGAGKPSDAGRPESPGKSKETHPPATAEKEQGSENRNTDRGKSGAAGKSGDKRPERVGRATTTTTAPATTTTTAPAATTTTTG